MKRSVFSSAPGSDPREHYIKNCSKEIELILPLIDKVRGKTLCLQSYTLSKGHLRALASACEVFDSHLVNRFFFDNCGIDDQEMAIILNACCVLGDFKSFVYKQN